MTTHPHAAAAVRAAQNYQRWGKYAATRYALKRGVHPALIRLARQLQAIEDFQAAISARDPFPEMYLEAWE